MVERCVYSIPWCTRRPDAVARRDLPVLVDVVRQRLHLGGDLTAYMVIVELEDTGELREASELRGDRSREAVGFQIEPVFEFRHSPELGGYRATQQLIGKFKGMLESREVTQLCRQLAGELIVSHR